MENEISVWDSELESIAEQVRQRLSGMDVGTSSDLAGNCLVIKTGKHEIWFGTANETIDADVTDENNQRHSVLETHVRSDAKSATAIAVGIVDAMNAWTKTEEKDERLETAVTDAENAFWSEIAKSYPEAASGDLEPLIVHQLRETMRAAVKRWVELNAFGGEL